ncbi:putative DNA-binding ribbon-helix-helix protein [Tardiphaga robiniae]|uniref:ribbon-helix-helix domain-containing protein n=1 Tax=Tardiphaga robiniae TaxID=943830 RepID=UPI002854742E|nr:ribbon-helix-helix domain-containing protein [Tardiphaga robiniae]MDR6659761.1 putative DNA-binding ribbon-helix-helix protein [Tardiphaga robiniae]
MGSRHGWAGTIRKRSVMIDGHKTSVSLEDQFWKSIKEIAAEREQRLTELINVIAEGRDRANLSSALRIFALNHYKQTRRR